MVTINLLPWREYESTYQKKISQHLLISTVLFTLILIGIVYFFLLLSVQRMEVRVITLTEKLKHFSAAQSALAEQQQQKIARHEQKNLTLLKSHTKALWQALAKQEMENVCFTSIQRRKNLIQFSGQAQSVDDLTAFLLHWQVASLFSEIKIDHFEQSENQTKINFVFSGNENNR